MNNLVLITSVINPHDKPFSYSNVRSVHSSDNRFEDTKKTFQTVKEKIPNSKIIIIECSELTEEQTKYLTENSDYFINIYNLENIHDFIFGLSKSLGEGTQTMIALDFIKENNIVYDNLIKISGRYWLNDNFDIELYQNNKIVFKYIENNVDNAFTALYKIPYELVPRLNEFLKNNINRMKSCIGYECLFAIFLSTIDKERLQNIEIVGLNGYVSVSQDYYEG